MKKLLLDTHVLLWWLADDKLLSAKARKLIADIRSTIVVSSASIWEISIKKALGKLNAPDDIEPAIRASGFDTLAINVPHALLAGALPRNHNDPFDRMLLAQAKTEELVILTHDKRFKGYDIPVNFV